MSVGRHGPPGPRGGAARAWARRSPRRSTRCWRRGSIPAADKLKARIPPGLVAVTRIPGLGPKRARLLYEHLGVDVARRPARGRRAGPPQGRARLRQEGRGERDGRARRRAPTAAQARMLLSKALAVGDELVAALRDHPAALKVELAGSARRRADDVKDLDIVAAVERPGALVEVFCALAAIDVVHSSGAAGARAVTHSGPPGRPAHRPGGGVRQPAPALHRLGQAQRGAAHARRSSAACT